ncbi:MAG: trypsin-like serine protease [Mycobacterium sp.]|nr:trypsin-like serine protease [Mycobacterium sp.]
MKQIHYSRWRRTAIAFGAASALGLVFTVVPSASAQPSDDQDPAVEQLAQEKGISSQEAEQRLVWQEHAADLDESLRSAITPDLYGGVWIGDDDRVKVGIVEPETALQASAPRSAIGTQAAAHQIGAATDVQPVRYALASLEAANTWLGDQLEVVNQNATWPLEAGYSPAANAVRLGVPQDLAGLTPAQQNVVDQARQRFDGMLDVYTYTDRVQPDACSFRGDTNCDPPLRGGVTISPARCTLGFIGRGRVDRRLYAFTAGHCVHDLPGGTTYTARFPNNSVHNIGRSGRNVFNRNGDAAIIQVTNAAGWQPRAWVTVERSGANGGVPGTTPNDHYPIRRDSTSLEGMRVCHSGFTTGTSCGRVVDLGVIRTYEGVTVRNLAQTNYCRDHGDSGGPVFARGAAYGLHVAGTGCTGYYQGIRGAENLMQVNVSADG